MAFSYLECEAWMAPTAALFLHNGLGDGVNGLVLSNNLHLNGWNVDTYHNSMGQMGRWFPHLPIKRYPSLAEIPKILQSYDWIFVVQNDTDPFILSLIQEGKRRCSDRVKVIYLYPSKNVVKEPYYNDCLTEPTVSVAENLRSFSQKILHLPKATFSNGIIPPVDLISQKQAKRVVIHPTSARKTRNWPQSKFIQLAKSLDRYGYEVVFVPGEEASEWEELGVGRVETFVTLNDLAQFLYESKYLIGNDSGLGHLASCLGVSTLTICRRKAWSKMWGPSFSKSVVVTPASWIINIRGLRLRDRYWRRWISVEKVEKGFLKLAATS